MRSRRGFSLVELLVVLSVGTVMLMVAMSVLYMLKETQVIVRQRLTVGRMTTRLADRFREDVHAASGIERVSDEASAPDAVVWRLTSGPDTIVRYEMGDCQVRRSRTIGEHEIHDDYRLPAGMRVVISAPEPDSLLTSLRFEVIDASVAGARPIWIEAVLGLANRHRALADRTTE